MGRFENVLTHVPPKKRGERKDFHMETRLAISALRDLDEQVLLSGHEEISKRINAAIQEIKDIERAIEIARGKK
jgi:hypothetical protein